MQNCSTGNKDEPSPSSLCDAASPERGGFALLTARWQNGESGEQSEMTGGVFHVLRPLRLLPLVAATSPKGRGKSSAGSFLIAPNTLATRAAACALSGKACRLCQLSQRESQDLKAVAKVLGKTRKFPVVVLPLPLGEVASRSDDGEGEPIPSKTFLFA